MKHVLPLKETEYRNVVKFIEGDVDFALFKINKMLYVLCHGNTCGLVQIGGIIMSLEDVLKLLIKNGLANDDIIGVRTISCHGAYQEYVTIDGITIGPEFTYKGTLETSVYVDLKYNYTITIEETKKAHYNDVI